MAHDHFDPKVINGIAIAVTGVWSVSYIADIIKDNYTPNPLLHAALVLVMTAAFGIKAIKRKNGGADNGE
jgi:hypothetical protein